MGDFFRGAKNVVGTDSTYNAVQRDQTYNLIQTFHYNAPVFYTQGQGATGTPNRLLNHDAAKSEVQPVPAAPSVFNRLSRYLGWLPTNDNYEPDVQPKNLDKDTQNTIDTNQLYYIKNRATGRFWSYVGDGMTGYVVCDRNLHLGAAYFHWSIKPYPQNKGMLIATAHAACPKVTESLNAGPTGGIFHFMPVPGEKDFYFIGTGLENNSLKVVTAQQTQDISMPGSLEVLAVNTKYQMWELIEKSSLLCELYYIKNCASGRFWSYIGDGMTGYVVCDRSLHYGAAYCQWSLTKGSQDGGIIIATAHATCPKVKSSLEVGLRGSSFYFIPVSGEKDRYFISTGLDSDPPKVVTARQAADESKPGDVKPLVLDNEYQMWEIFDAGQY